MNPADVHPAWRSVGPSVVVVTATVGRASLRRCAESVQAQHYPNVRHIVVVDGPSFAASARQVLADVSQTKKLDVVVLPQNTGHSGHYGYRIYGAMPLLADDDVICFLDEDNWFEPGHVTSGIEAMVTTGAAWAYSLRMICSEEGDRICSDDCDSLGYWPKFATLLPDAEFDAADEAARHRQSPNLVDSSCYFLPRDIACSVAPLWQAVHADSAVPTSLIQRFTGVCTGASTLNYALGGGSGTPAGWFIEGNARLAEIYGGQVLPWRREPVLLGPGTREHPVRSEPAEIKTPRR